MFDFTLLAVFIPTFFVVSITPGLCMTLAMTLGMSIGVRKAMWMMWGELLGVAIVAIASVLGVSAIMLNSPMLFTLLKVLGAAYLFWVGTEMWRSKGKLAIQSNNEENQLVLRRGLFTQGLFTAIANPKGWAFMISLLPPFINPALPLPTQLSLLVLIILCSEFVCMMIYAAGGKTIGRQLTRRNNVKLLNRLSGCLMMMVALWSS